MGANLPLRHRDRLLLAERDDWTNARESRSGDAVLLVRSTTQGDVLMARGEAAGISDLLDAESRLRHRSGAEGALWLSAPRSVIVPAPVLDALELTRASGWDWMATHSPPVTEAAHGSPEQVAAIATSVRALDLDAYAPYIRSVLRQANPRSTADPAGNDEVAWWGAFCRGELIGVIGARRQQGDPERRDISWHLHGLGVLPVVRGGGYGQALTAAATRDGLAAGADWVSLGLYADNEGARRLYTRLGFTLEAEMASYGPVPDTFSI